MQLYPYGTILSSQLRKFQYHPPQQFFWMRTTHYAITMPMSQQLRCKCGNGGTEINDDSFDTVLHVQIFSLGLRSCDTSRHSPSSLGSLRLQHEAIIPP